MTAASEPARSPGKSTTARPVAPGTRAKTSAAATFSLVFGVGLLLGIIGVILAIFGLRMSRRPGVTGRGVAIGGLVLSALAVLLGLAIAAGVSTFVNNQQAVDRLEKRVSDLRDKLND